MLNKFEDSGYPDGLVKDLLPKYLNNRHSTTEFLPTLLQHCNHQGKHKTSCQDDKLLEALSKCESLDNKKIEIFDLIVDHQESKLAMIPLVNNIFEKKYSRVRVCMKKADWKKLCEYLLVDFPLKYPKVVNPLIKAKQHDPELANHFFKDHSAQCEKNIINAISKGKSIGVLMDKIDPNFITDNISIAFKESIKTSIEENKIDTLNMIKKAIDDFTANHRLTKLEFTETEQRLLFENANMNCLSAIFLLKVIIFKDLQGSVTRLLERNIKTCASKEDVANNLLTLTQLDNVTLTQASLGRLDKNDKSTIGIKALTECLHSKKNNSAEVLLKDIEIRPLPKDLPKGNLKIDVIVLEWQRKEQGQLELPLINFAIDKERYDLAEYLFTSGKAEKVNFIHYAMRKRNFVQPLRALWKTAPGDFFIQIDPSTSSSALHRLAQSPESFSLFVEILEGVPQLKADLFKVRDGNNATPLHILAANSKNNGLILDILKNHPTIAKTLRQLRNGKDHSLIEIALLNSNFELISSILNNFKTIREELTVQEVVLFAKSDNLMKSINFTECELLNFTKKANSIQMSCMPLIKSISQQKYERFVDEIHQNIIKEYASQKELFQSFALLSKWNNSELTTLILSKLDKDQKKYSGKEILQESINAKRFETSVSLLKDVNIPIPQFLLDGLPTTYYTQDVDKLILKRKHEKIQSTLSIVIFAIDEKRIDLAKTLIEDSSNQVEDNFILHILSCKRDLSWIIDALEKLLKFAPERFFTQTNSSGEIALNILASNQNYNELTFKIFNTFQHMKHNINTYKNSDNLCPLELAIINSNFELAKPLLKEETLILDEFSGRNVLHASITAKKQEFSSFLLEKYPDIRLKTDSLERSPLHYAVEIKSTDILDILLENSTSDLDQQENETMNNCLHFAIKSKFFKGAFTILSYDQSLQFRSMLNSYDKNKKTPVFLALETSSKTLVSKALNYKLLDYSIRDEAGKNILHYSVEHSALEAVKGLIANGGSFLTNEKDDEGDTPLMMAIVKLKQDIAKELLNHPDVDLSLKNASGMNVLMLALLRSDRINFHELFNPVNLKSKFQHEQIEQLINSKDEDGRFVLSFAIYKDIPNEIIKYVLESWSDVILMESVDEKKWNAFNHAFSKKNIKVMQWMLNCYQCSGSKTCITNWSPTDDHEIPFHTALKNLKEKFEEKVAEMIKSHDEMCCRDQILSYLRNPIIVEDLVQGSKFRLQEFLLKWNKSPTCNLLHIGTELGSVPLMTEIFKKARNGNKAAEYCIELGRDESIQFAAVNTKLEPLNFLLIDVDKSPGATFDVAIRNNPKVQEKMEDLLHEAAIHDCHLIFKWILESKPTTWHRDCFKKDQDKGTLFHSIVKGQTRSFELYNELLKHLDFHDDEKESLKEMFEKVDKDQNTVLHIAAIEPITDEKLKIISDMLKQGAIPSLKNKNGQTFLEMSSGMSHKLCTHINNMEDDWFKNLIQNKKLLKSFIDLRDDTIFCAMLKKFSNLSNVEGAEHPIDFIEHIWNNKKVLKESFKQLLIWEANYHRNDLKKLKECCHKKLDDEKNYIVFNEMEKNVEIPFGIGYCAKKIFQNIFLLFFIMKFVDFATDVTLNIEYYVDEFKDFPNKTKCDAMTNPTITCYFHKMNGKILFITSMCIFALTYCFDLIFVMSDQKSNHYYATLVGFCCWSNFVESTSRVKKVFFYLCWAFLFAFNQVLAALYGFLMELFVDYWRPTDNQRPVTSRQDCGWCLNCDHYEDEEVGMCSGGIKCICIFCSRNANDSKESQAKLQELKNDSFFVMTLDKVVTSSTENSFMPLVQLSIVFPYILYWFPKETVTETFTQMMHVPLNITANTTLADLYPYLTNNADLKTDLKFTVTAISIITSFISMASTLTITYFAKPGRQTYVNLPRWLLYFSSIIFQVMPKMLAYQVFAFGFVGRISANLIIPSMVFIPLSLCFIRALVYYCYIHKFRPDFIEPEKRFKACLLFGFSTIYTFNEQYFYTTERQRSTNTNERKDLLYCHLAFDSFSLMENFCLGIDGGLNIVDSNFNTTIFMIWLVGMHVLGLILKTSYYIFLHPWESLNPKYNKVKLRFLISSGILGFIYFFIIAMFSSIYIRIFIGIVSTMMISLILLIVGHGKISK